MAWTNYQNANINPRHQVHPGNYEIPRCLTAAGAHGTATSARKRYRMRGRSTCDQDCIGMCPYYLLRAAPSGPPLPTVKYISNLQKTIQFESFREKDSNFKAVNF